MNRPEENSFAGVQADPLLKSRKAADARFRYYGLAAICFALFALLILVFAIGSRAVSAVTYHFIRFEISLDPTKLLVGDEMDRSEVERNIEGFYGLLQDDLLLRFPEGNETKVARSELSGLVTRLAAQPLARRTAGKPETIGRTVSVKIPISDDMDLYLKNPSAWQVRIRTGIVQSASASDAGQVVLVGDKAFSHISASVLAAAGGANEISNDLPILIQAGGSMARMVSYTDDQAIVDMLTGRVEDFAGHRASALVLKLPESERTLSDQQIAWALALKHEGRISRDWHTNLFTNTDSTYPELAGALAAIAGSLLTMLVVATLAVPIGIFASIYLEEFAPRNRITSLIEVNINNLAAVPSIVFGLLGAAMFLGFLGLPRSVPLVGGLVLGLLILPVVIIASRASLRAVPDSVRAGALAVGASRMQAVFHHVLPMAAPGMLTGAILGMARALGETAPLLLIGMVAFVAEVPNSVMDESTALPVLIYSWATSAERAWESMTAAAIAILVGLMVVMNTIVVLLRRRFERRH